MVKESSTLDLGHLYTTPTDTDFDSYVNSKLKEDSKNVAVKDNSCLIDTLNASLT